LPFSKAVRIDTPRFFSSSAEFYRGHSVLFVRLTCHLTKKKLPQ
jgi:hypothetical protein